VSARANGKLLQHVLRLGRATLFVAAWIASLIAAAALVARFIPVTNHKVLTVAAWSPYLMVCALLAALLLLLTRRWWSASVAVILTAAAILVELPLFVGSGQAPANSVPIRVLTANLREGAADPEALVAITRDRTDVLLVQELTPSQDGLDSDLPYKVLDARPFAAGVGIWSRYPVVRSSRIPGYELGVLSAAVRVPQAADDFIVSVAHLVGPWPQPLDGWRQEIAMLPGTMGEIAAGAGNSAAIVAGDFNATFDMEPFRRLLRNGFRDAAEQSGAGLTPSFAADSALPPVFGIDHILTLNSSASDVRTVRIPGSDHLGLSATIHIPG
jgi:endonuclease/exonuclease/phosphatase family metal-dependent hydrolase